MKYLVVLVLILLVAWQWRSARIGRVNDKSAAKDIPPGPVNMVACAHCGVHLPANDAVMGTAGAYCDTLHRAAAER